MSHAASAVATTAPDIWAATNAGMSARRIPENVSVSVRPMVTAGLAKLVEAVNQYAAAM